MTETELYRGGRWIRRVRRSALLLLIGLVLLVFLFNLGSLNGDDLRRFAARVSFGLHGQALIEDGRISYLDDESRQAALYKDGLAVVANDKLKIYDSTGLEFFQHVGRHAQPRAADDAETGARIRPRRRFAAGLQQL